MIGVTLTLAAPLVAACLVRDAVVPGQAIALPCGWTATGEAPESAEMIRACDPETAGEPRFRAVTPP